MASANNSTNNNNGGLPVIPLSPIAQSFIICKNAISQATEKLTEAKKVRPHLGVDVLRGFLETVKLERHRLDTLTRKMQSVEAATSLFWDSDALARQIAVIDCQLFSNVLLDKRSLSQLDAEGTKLVHLVDFHHYLTHSFAHQLVYWAELIKPENASTVAAAVVPPVHATKDSLVTHLVRVAYLLLHAYRDFSGFAAIMKALTVPEVRRLKKLWSNCSSRTKEMFRDLAQIIAPAKNYQAYHACLRTKLDVHHQTGSGGMMIAIPWVQPHILSIRSIVTAYTAGDDHDQQRTGDIVLSAPGAHKLNIDLSILELCQHNSTISANLEDILTPTTTTTDKKSKRASLAASSKAIHIEGLRAAVIPVANLNHLAPGDQLTHHWLASRVYLRKDQLINESIEVEPLKPGESITCDKDEFEEAMIQQTKYIASRPVSNATSRRTSSVRPQPSRTSSPPPAAPAQVNEEPEFFEQELVDIVRPTIISRESSVHDSDSEDDNDDADGGLDVVVDNKYIEIPLVKPIQELNVEEHEVTLHPTTTLTELEPQNESKVETPAKEQPAQEIIGEEDEEEVVVIISEEEPPVVEVAAVEEEQQKVGVEKFDDNKDPLLGHEVSTKEEEEQKKVDIKEEQQQQPEKAERVNNHSAGNFSVVSSSNSTSVSKQKPRLSPTAPEFVPGGANSNHNAITAPPVKKSSSIVTTTTSADEKWLGYPIKEEDEEVSNKDTDSEKWNGYPVPKKATMHPKINEDEEEDDDEVWKGYPGPNSSTDSPRRASSQSETSEEWKGYHATKMEADWQRESALKVQEHEWQGYALETLNEDELDSSTMMDGEFEKSRQARGLEGNNKNEENFSRKRRV